MAVRGTDYAQAAIVTTSRHRVLCLSAPNSYRVDSHERSIASLNIPVRVANLLRTPEMNQLKDASHPAYWLHHPDP